ncbi:transketolase [Microlunatus endophyticus]|uniref:Transketolase n=1 Tax=Microlunatus endophyticus TaxID=1716077 RepID=A0A917S427_9ACTN|nr:transketolase C-terminal domain-containing protein [Microlunatus endophyticus]GGL55597.1 transketolase [Microlunatus endophyticus]
MDLRSQFVSTASALVDSDPRVAVVLAEISADQFAGASATHPDRVLNVGIREQLMVSMAGGLALAGLRPIAHSFGAFVIERAWEQVKLDLDHQDVGAILVGAYGSYDWAEGGRTHQSPGDVALIDTLSDWVVHVPGHPAELDAQLRSAAADDTRVYLRIGGRSNPEAFPTHHDAWSVLRQGSAGTVVAVGPTLRNTLPAVSGLDVTVLYAPTVRPFDADTLRSTLRTPRIVMVEPYLAGTSAAHVARALADLDHRQLGLGVTDPDPHRYGTLADHDRLHGLDPRSLRQLISGFLIP